MPDPQMEEIAGAVLTSRLSSLPVAVWLRDRLKEAGFQASIGTIPGAPGYQVSVQVRSRAEIKAALLKMSVIIKDA